MYRVFQVETDTNLLLVTYSQALALLYHHLYEYGRGVPCWIREVS